MTRVHSSFSELVRNIIDLEECSEFYVSKSELFLKEMKKIKVPVVKKFDVYCDYGL